MNIDTRITVPLIYIDPISLLKSMGEPDLSYFSSIKDLWENYNLNIRYLHVISDIGYEDVKSGKATLNDLSKLPKQFKTEVVSESNLLEFLRPSHIVAFFGLRDRVPANHKVHSSEELKTGEYKTRLAGHESSTQMSRKPRRQAKRREGYL